MSCSQTCIQGQKTFIFSTNQANFEDAQRQCRNKEATLTTNLNQKDYSKFLSCCSDINQDARFWIGLENVDTDTCRSRLHWIDSGGCVNEVPLKVQTQPPNNVCRAVFIQPGQQEDNGNVPRSNTDLCASNHFYICQRIRPKISTTRRTTTSTLRSIATTTTTTKHGRRKSTSFLATAQKNSSDKINDQATSITSDTSNNVGTIVGGVVSCFVLVLIFLLFLYWRKRKNIYTKKSICFQTKSNPKKFISRSVNDRINVDQTNYNFWNGEALNPVPASVKRSSEKHHNEVLNSFVEDSDHMEPSSHNETQEDYSESNDYREINNQANDLNVYDQVAKYDVEYASSKYDQLPVKREQKDHLHCGYSHTNKIIPVQVEGTANKSPALVYATVERNKTPPIDDVYAVVDKSKPSN